MWTNEALEIAMDVVERRAYCLKKASKYGTFAWDHFFDHLNNKTRSKKMGPKGVFIKEEDVAMVYEP